MKLYSCCILSLVVLQVTSFSATVPTGKITAAASSTANVDKTMTGIDADGSFDPTEGENPALTRNNLGEVWNQQVSVLI
jgi:hypothetical protein